MLLSLFCFLKKVLFLTTYCKKSPVSQLHKKVANQRKDFLHKFSRQINNAYTPDAKSLKHEKPGAMFKAGEITMTTALECYDDVLVGTVVIVKTCEEEFCSLTEAEAEDLRKMFG